MVGRTKSIPADFVASALFKAGDRNEPGKKCHEYANSFGTIATFRIVSDPNVVSSAQRTAALGSRCGVTLTARQTMVTTFAAIFVVR